MSEITGSRLLRREHGTLQYLSSIKLPMRVDTVWATRVVVYTFEVIPPQDDTFFKGIPSDAHLLGVFFHSTSIIDMGT